MKDRLNKLLVTVRKHMWTIEAPEGLGTSAEIYDGFVFDVYKLINGQKTHLITDNRFRGWKTCEECKKAALRILGDIMDSYRNVEIHIEDDIYIEKPRKTDD